MAELRPARAPRDAGRPAANSVVVGLLLLTSALSAGGASTAVQTPIASIGTAVLTDADLSEAVRSKEAKQRVDHERRRREIALDAKLGEADLHAADVERLVNERVLALEAADKHTTPAALLDAVKATAATAAEAREVYEAHAREINQPYAAVEQPLIEELTRQHRDDARHEYLTGLRARHHAKVLLEPLRFDVATEGPARGAAGAPVTMILFADFQCPYCAQLVPVLSQVLASRPHDVRLVYRHLPLESLHPLAAGAALGAACAERQGRFWEMYDALFANPKQLAPEALRATAVSLGADGAAYDACLTDPATQQRSDRDVAVADDIGLSGTPALFINGRLLRGTQALGSVLRVVDDELARHAAGPPAHR